tara:strand:- start:15 stop:287 length:273 start_codon:yes stop_codon:yes gene_type:complete
MKKLLFLLPLFFMGCVTQSPAVRSPRYFNQEIDILDYHATYIGTEWTLKAQPGETMRLVFNYEIIDIDFIESKDEPGEYIFTVKSQVHGQ